MEFNPAKALLNGMAQMWYVWLVLGLVLIGRLVFYLLEQQKLAKSGSASRVRSQRAVGQISIMPRQAQHERKSHMISTHHRSP